jgi:hypothetical protein
MDDETKDVIPEEVNPQSDKTSLAQFLSFIACNATSRFKELETQFKDLQTKIDGMGSRSAQLGQENIEIPEGDFSQVLRTLVKRMRSFEDQLQSLEDKIEMNTQVNQKIYSLVSQLEKRLRDVPLNGSSGTFSNSRNQDLEYPAYVEVLVNAYNKQPELLNNYFETYEVSETKSFLGGNFLEAEYSLVFAKTPNGSFLALRLKNRDDATFWLVPRVNLIVNEFNYGALAQTFECSGYEDRFATKIKLMRPGMLQWIEEQDFEGFGLRFPGALEFE